MEKLQSVLKEKFGYEELRPGQDEIIQAVLSGKDVAAILPTGMGKSLCYQLPAYMLGGTVLIISPLLSLMQDQVEQLKRMGEKRVVALNSFLSYRDKQRIVSNLSSYRFVFTSPEMINQPNIRERLAKMKLSLIVADEAHCISQWGFDFRPDYLRISDWLKTFERPPVLALTATATKKVVQDIQHYLQMKHPFIHIHSLDRPNIRYIIKQLEDLDEKNEWLINHTASYAGPGIIYTQSRQRSEALSSLLNDNGIRSGVYHAGMEQEDRVFVQQQFLSGEIHWVCATNAFGMGIHKDNIRQVIHEHLPATPANYIQEVGRAGRDGNDAAAILLYSEGDSDRTRFVVNEEIPTKLYIDMILEKKINGENPARLVEDGVMKETDYRVLSYWLERTDPEETIHMMERLRMDKDRQIQDMVKLIDNSTCIREKILFYFGQKLDPQHRPSNCCSVCGAEIEEFLSLNDHELPSTTIATWEDRIHQLFPI